MCERETAYLFLNNLFLQFLLIHVYVHDMNVDMNGLLCLKARGKGDQISICQKGLFK